MIRRIAIACTAIAMLAGCAERRQMAINYTKAGVDDVVIAQDRQSFQKVSGVANVIAEGQSDGSVRVQIFVEDGKELGVYAKASELGYTRLK